MAETTSVSGSKLLVREITIDDLPTAYHIGEEVFSAAASPSLYRTWAEYKIVTDLHLSLKLSAFALIRPSFQFSVRFFIFALRGLISERQAYILF
ncbi:MAG: hypothetical protein GWO11_00905 [Desulfuromonadales bacterium]|nr:hypothetical protein [Desulfuromonadales bacterium]NIR33069.1 hypothetical protein [Desulfuromonadales bacterium]NIS39307.1 hypothetical protein [Desulfuromonadales bacterium]